MRTKTLLLSAVLGALSCASMMAQVYSLNAVGYVNVTCPAQDSVTGLGGWAIIANQLNSGDNSITNLIPVDATMNGDTIYKYNSVDQSWASFQVTRGVWPSAIGNTTLNPGEAAFFFNPNTAITLTFVGTVLQGSLTNSLVPAYSDGSGGFNLVSSIVPQGGDISTNLGITVDSTMNGDTVYVYDTTAQGYNTYQVSRGAWSPSAPRLAVGQGFFFYNANNALNWTRTFTVN
jgi:hypothetical protein